MYWFIALAPVAPDTGILPIDVSFSDCASFGEMHVRSAPVSIQAAHGSTLHVDRILSRAGLHRLVQMAAGQNRDLKEDADVRVVLSAEARHVRTSRESRARSRISWTENSPSA